MLSRVGSAPPPPPDANDRSQAIAAIAEAIATAQRRRRVRRWSGGFAAAAAIVLTGFAGYRVAARSVPVALAPATTEAVAQIVAHPVSGGSSVVVSGAQAPLDDGRLLGPGSRVVTPANGSAMLSFSTGSTALLREKTDMTIVAEGLTQTLHLDLGSVELHVAKLAPDHRFIVVTPDSEVEVRGTRFTVSVVAPDPGCGAGTRTRVTVTEGVVAVRHDATEDRIAMGDQWPRGCQRATAASIAGPRPATSPPIAFAPNSGSTLADQNDLFATAAAARRRGDSRGAVAALDRFLAVYPASPLGESASAERMRILRTMGRSRSLAAAKEYLAHYPNGFAHSEAEAIAAESP
jgi:ferric-dicitrate binding protein FerR (iron transport regulator)